MDVYLVVNNESESIAFQDISRKMGFDWFLTKNCLSVQTGLLGCPLSTWPGSLGVAWSLWGGLFALLVCCWL